MIKLRLLLFTLFCATCAGLLYDCQGPAAASQVNFDPGKVPYPKLSDYAFFTGKGAKLNPNSGVLPYEPITPLFTDYAHKARYVWLPPGTQAEVDEEGSIQFPEHAMLIKHFYYPADFRRPQANWDMVETRLLFKRQGKWEAFTYIWNERGSDAALNIIGDFKAVAWADERGQDHQLSYIIPNKNQCKSCHNRDKELLPIGPKASNLNSSLSYPDGSTSNQLAKWQEEGILARGDWGSLFPPIAQWDDPGRHGVTERALAYLDANCGHCHNPQGSAHTSGLYLTPDFAADPARLGICKTPVAAGKGSGGHKYSILPGKPDSSILLYRMESDEPGIMMPEIGRAIPHQEGLALIREWIIGLEGECR